MKRLVCLLMLVAAVLMSGAAIAGEKPAPDKAAPDKTAPEKDCDKDCEKTWEFSGQALFYYQTADRYGSGSLFDQGPGSPDSGWAAASAAVQVGGVAKNLAGDFGAGFQVSGISALGLHHDVVSGMVQNAGSTTDGMTGGIVNQGYLTYAAGKTHFKVGRQELPKSLSPFAFSEGWNALKNSFDAALVVNSSLEDTTLVYAYVTDRNNSVGNLNDFTGFYGSHGVHMLTAQNKSIDKVTLTGSYYSLPDATEAGNARAYWFDATYAGEAIKVGLQGGSIGGDGVPDDTSGFGAMISGKIGQINATFAYSSAGDGTLNIANLAGAGVKSPFYTQGILNQNGIKRDSDSFKLALSTKALGGGVTLAILSSDMGKSGLPSVFGLGVGGEGTYREYELLYKRGLGKSTKMFLALIRQTDDRQEHTGQNFLRLWFRYNF